MRLPRVLVVDDEPGIRTSLTGVLEDEGYDVTAVPDGESCLACVAEQSPIFANVRSDERVGTVERMG